MLLTRRAAESARAKSIFDSYQDAVYVRTDRFFAFLLMLQWLAGIVIAVFVSPRAWVGLTSYLHPHVWAAVFLCGLISLVPAAVAWFAPGRTLTRHLIAVCQILTSALLIHLTGGRIETHFHIFGSLAFLAFYRDWRVLVTATLVVLFDHLLRGYLWPESVYGTLTAPIWRSFEHAGWVVFEDTFLIMSIQQSLHSMWHIALQKAELEQAHADVEEKVRIRTRELAATNEALSHEIAERARAEAEREELQKRFVETARRVGMAEVATSVLHNVGNVLTSVNVSATVASERLRKLGIADLQRAVTLLEEHRHDLGHYITEDSRGRHLPDYLVALGREMSSQEGVVLAELAELMQHIDHIKGVVSVQQAHAGATGMVEVVSIGDLIDDAICINEASIGRHGIEIVREYHIETPVEIEKHKLLQILVNIISNAKYALIEEPSERPRIIVRTDLLASDEISIEVEDNGMGIAPENLARIFEHGFTTRREGHGYGLHSAALAAQELGGTVSGTSAGRHAGAFFRITLPIQPIVRHYPCTT